MRFSVCLFTPAKDLVQGGVPGKEGRMDNLICSSDGNTVTPDSDKRILKDRKTHMVTVGESVVRGRCPGGLSC